MSLAVLALSLNVAAASAQDWAEKMFAETSHDFGAVARAGKIEHRFVLTNQYRDDVHIASVRSSCGCTMPRIEKDTLKSREQGAIVAAFNTSAFSGQRSAQVTVTIDKPTFAEVRLQVRGYIRTDVVLDPGQVSFGSVDRGDTAEKKISVDYTGRGDWKIVEVKSNSPYLAAAVREKSRAGGRVSYELAVQLKESTPAGYFQDKLVLMTDDQHTPQLPVTVEGLVVSPLTVSPANLSLGVLQPGQTVTRQFVVKGKQPFRIVEIQGEDDALAFATTDEAKTVHVIPVRFTAGTQLGKISKKIVVKTDLNDHATVQLIASGEIAPPLVGN